MIPSIVPFHQKVKSTYNDKTATQNRYKQTGGRGPPMSARQNKKQRKNRNNANNRERTVTTLTQDPSTPYLVPTPSEEPAGGHLAAHFSPTAANKIINVSMGPQPYQMTQKFGSVVYGGGFVSPVSNLHPQQHQTFYQPTQSQVQPNLQQQQQGQESPPIQPGKNDLEILQNLKQLIIENQHPFFRAVPQPVALAKLYRGSLTSIARQGQRSGAESTNEPGDTGAPTVDPKPPTTTSGQQQTLLESVIVSSPSTTSVNQNIRFNNSSANLAQKLDMREDGSVPESLSVSNEKSSGKYEYPTRSVVQKANSAADGGGFNGAKAEPMDEEGALLSIKDSAEGWIPNPNPSALYSDNGHSDSDRAAASRGNLPTGSDSLPFDESAGLPSDAPDRDMDSRRWALQDRHRRPSDDRWRDVMHSYPDTKSSVSDQRQIVDAVVQSGPDELSVPVDARRSADIIPPPSASDPLRVSDVPPVDPRSPVDYHMNTVSRMSLPSRPESDDVMTSKLSPALGSRAPAQVGAASPELYAQDRMNPASRQSTHDSVTAPGEHGPRFNSRPSPHFIPKKKFYKNQIGTNNSVPHSDPSRSAYARPSSPTFGLPPPPGSARSFRQRSPSIDGHRGRQPPSATGARVRDYRGPPSRDISRDRPIGYRADYGGPEAPIRYGDGRPYGREYSPLPPGERGPPPDAYPPPPSGGGPSGRDWGYGSYRRDWTSAEEDTYLKSRGWEGRSPVSERERYEREYIPPRSAGWAERDYPGRDLYPPGPPPPLDDRYSDRGRPPAVYPPFSRVRPRSPSPLDDRLPMKRPREEYPPVDYYPPASGRRGPPEYPPPRSGSPGPPGSSWPPPSSSASTGLPGAGIPDRDFRMGPPPSGGYDRPRSPGPPGRAPYTRGGAYGRDGRSGYPPRP